MESGSFVYAVDEVDFVDQVDLAQKLIGFPVQFVHKVHSLQKTDRGRLPP